MEETQSKGTLAKLMARATSGPNGGGEIKPRMFKFTIDKSVCNPGLFDDDVVVVMQSPTAAMEIKATKRAEQDPILLTKELARIAIVSIDGDPVKDSDLSRDAFWEALGTAGRGLLTTAFLQALNPSGEAEGKAAPVMLLA